MSPILCPHVFLIIKMIKILGFEFTINVQKDKKSEVLSLGLSWV